jgi:hypothetical protein
MLLIVFKTVREDKHLKQFQYNGKIRDSCGVHFFFFKGLTKTDIKKKLNSTLGDSSPSNTTIKRWVEQVPTMNHVVDMSFEVTTPGMIEKIHKIVLTGRREKVKERAGTVSICTEGVCNILHEILRQNNSLINGQEKGNQLQIRQRCIG